MRFALVSTSGDQGLSEVFEDVAFGGVYVEERKVVSNPREIPVSVWALSGGFPLLSD